MDIVESSVSESEAGRDDYRPSLLPKTGGNPLTAIAAEPNSRRLSATALPDGVDRSQMRPDSVERAFRRRSGEQRAYLARQCLVARLALGQPALALIPCERVCRSEAVLERLPPGPSSRELRGRLSLTG